MELDDSQIKELMQYVAQDYIAGGYTRRYFGIEQFLGASMTSQDYNLPTHHRDILPEKFSKGLEYPQPFEADKVVGDIEWYQTYGHECSCSVTKRSIFDTLFDTKCGTCVTACDMKEEHLLKQLETERYMHEVKSRVEKMRAHEERTLRGGYIWQRAFKSAKRAWQGKPRPEPFDIDDLPRLALAVPDGSSDDEQAPDSESDTPRLSLTRVRAHQDKYYKEVMDNMSKRQLLWPYESKQM